MRLILPEQKTSNLNTLSRRSIILLSKKGRMRRPRNTTFLRIKLLDEQSLIRPHFRRIVPLVRSWIGLDLPRLRASPRCEFVAGFGFCERFGQICIDGDEIIRICCSGIAESKVVAGYFVEGSSEVDNGPSTLLKLFGFGILRTPSACYLGLILLRRMTDRRVLQFLVSGELQREGGLSTYLSDLVLEQ